MADDTRAEVLDHHDDVKDTSDPRNQTQAKLLAVVKAHTAEHGPPQPAFDGLKNTLFGWTDDGKGVWVFPASKANFDRFEHVAKAQPARPSSRTGGTQCGRRHLENSEWSGRKWTIERRLPPGLAWGKCFDFGIELSRQFGALDSSNGGDADVEFLNDCFPMPPITCRNFAYAHES